MSSIDSVVSIASAINTNEPVPGKFYYYSKFIFNGYRIDWSRSTIDQLIQSGNLRYFRDKDLIRAIQFYYYMQGIISEQNQMELAHRDRVIEFRNRILKGRYYSAFASLNIVKEEYGHVPSQQVDSLMNIKLPLQEEALQYLDEYINHVVDRKSRLDIMTERYYSLASETAIDIIYLLKENFHFK